MSVKVFRITGIINIFENVTESFSGTYIDSNKEVMKMKEELDFDEIPSISSDRNNLRKDAGNVARDYKKAFDYKKEKLVL